MTNEKLLQRMRTEAKELRLDYLHCKDIKKSSKLLKKRNKKMSTVHRLQTSINFLFINQLDEQNYLREIAETNIKNQYEEKIISYI